MRTRLRRHLYERFGISMHAQNLSQEGGLAWRANGKETLSGPMWRHGRAWISWARGDERTWHKLFEITPEWCLEPHATAALSVQIGGGDSSRELMLHLDVMLARLFLSFEPLPRWLTERLPGYWIDGEALRSGRPYQHRHGGAGRFKVTEEHAIRLQWHHG